MAHENGDNQGEHPQSPLATTEFNFSTLKIHRPFSYSEKEPQSNDVYLHFEEFSNVHNSDRSPNATRSNLAYKNV